MPCSCAPSGCDRKRCCCGGSSGGSGDGSRTGTTIYPVLIENGSATATPSPSHAGTHGSLPFNDPFWKLLLACAVAILAATASYFTKQSGDSGSIGPTGAAETDPLVHCCSGLQAQAETKNGIAGALYDAVGVLLIFAAAADEVDLFYRGQTATPGTWTIKPT
jgi:hypothetical protein